MSIERAGRSFGDGRLFSDQEDAFFDLPIEEQARALGWSEACPVVERLIKPEAEGGRGAESMRNRYAQVIFWLGYSSYLFERMGRQDLSRALYAIEQRKASEPLGTHDEGWVPSELKTHIFRSPMAYGIPRIITEYLTADTEKRGSSLVKVIDFLEAAAQQSSNLIETAVFLADAVVANLLERGEREKSGLLLRHLIGRGKLEEDNTLEAYRNIFTVLKNHAPVIYDFYTSLTVEEKKRFRLIDESELYGPSNI